MTEEIEKKSLVLSPDEIEVEEEKIDYRTPGKIFIVSLLGGLTAGILFYIFEQLSDDKKEHIKNQVSGALKAHFKKWAED